MIVDNLLEENIDITSLSQFNTKAKTRYFFEINCRQQIDKLSNIKKFSKEQDLELLFLWDWTNVLFGFDFFEWIIIKNNYIWWDYDEKTKILKINSWEKIDNVATSLYQNKQEIFKRFIGLPWSLGWAVYWNAWCFGLEIENNFIEAEILDLNTSEIKVYTKKMMNFSYRNSIIKQNNNLFIISATFDLSEIKEKYSSDVDNVHFRQSCQPKWYTCWSFFKNPNRENSAWKIIEELWFKWKNINWAYFSELHANFLINDGEASYMDLINLINIIKQEAKEKYKIELVPEVNIIQNKIKIRLQKHLSSAWICSRRKAEEYIKSGLITVNGSVAKIWDKVDPSIDKILLLDKAITQQQNFVYYKLNKPRWIVTTCAQYSEKNIIDIVDIKERVFPIWRLDKDTSWLILLTNDWRLANFLMHPRYNHEKEYLVETYQIISNSQLEKLRNWLMILGSKTKRANINRISNNKFSIIITEWKNRQIRRMLEKVWSRVNKLKRIRIENIQLWNLQIGEYKKLSIEEKNKLFKKLQIN